MSDTPKIKLGNGYWFLKKSGLLAYREYIGGRKDTIFEPIKFDVARATSATRINKLGIMELVDSNIPRIDFLNSDKGESLVQIQATNKITRSSQLSLIPITSVKITITDNQTTSPDGSLNASIIEVNATDQQYFGQSISDVGDKVISAFVKYNGSATKFYIGYFSTTNDVANATFNIQNGTILSQVTGSTNNKILENSGIEDYGNGWYRCWVHISGSSGVVAYGIVTDDSTSYIPAPSVTGINLFVWGLQYELGKSPTSYIPTSGAAVTRNLDLPILNSIEDFYNQIEGTFYMEFDYTVTTGTRYFMSLFNGTPFTRVRTTNGISIQIEMYDGSLFLTQFNKTTGNQLVNGRNKVAWSYKAGEQVSICINGDNSEGGGVVASFPLYNIMNLGQYNSSGQGATDGIYDFRYYDYKMTNTEIETLTTPITEIVRVPKISGDAFIGVTLTISQFADWTTGLNGTVSGSYVWQSSSNGSSWTNISGTDNVSTYTIVQSDLNKYIRVNQTITDGTTTDIKGSIPTSIVRDLLNVVQPLFTTAGYTSISEAGEQRVINEIL